MVTALIVDDHPMVRDGLAAMLAARKSVQVVQTCADGESAIAYVRSNGCPDIVLSDVRMPGIDGFEAIARLRRYHPKARVLLLAGMPLREECERAKSCGAAGYMSKSADIDRLVQAIEELVANPESFAEDSFVPAPSILSPREMDVLRLMSKGFQRDGIAANLGIGAETVKSRIKSLMLKLDVSNAAQAINRAYELGILRA